MPTSKSKKMTNEELVKPCMKNILQNHPNGLRARELQDTISEQLPTVNWKSIGACMSDLTKKSSPEFIKKKEKGSGTFYFLASASDASTDETKESTSSQHHKKVKSLHEPSLYEPFAHYLKIQKDKNDDCQSLDECLVAVKWGNEGGTSPLGKWATPDVIGVFRPERDAYVKFSDEIVSAEIKVDHIFTGFGQACSYLLFSHKVYLVVPDDESYILARLRATCHIIGLGLVTYDSRVLDSKEELDSSIFQTQLRARRQEPDTYYINEAIPEHIRRKLGR